MTKRSYGDGGIDQRGENNFRLRYRIGQQRYSVAFQGTLKEAKTKLRELLKSGDDGKHAVRQASIDEAGGECERRQWGGARGLQDNRIACRQCGPHLVAREVQSGRSPVGGVGGVVGSPESGPSKKSRRRASTA